MTGVQILMLAGFAVFVVALVFVVRAFQTGGGTRGGRVVRSARGNGGSSWRIFGGRRAEPTPSAQGRAAVPRSAGTANAGGHPRPAIAPGGAVPVDHADPVRPPDPGRRGKPSRPPSPTGERGSSRFRRGGSRSGPVPLGQPLVLDNGTERPTEPRLPGGKVVAGSTWTSAFFQGYCGPAQRGRPLVVRGAALRGIRHADEGLPGQDVIGAAWHEPRQALLVTAADGLGKYPDSGTVAELVTLAALKGIASPTADLNLRAPQVFRDIAETVTDELAGRQRDGRRLEGATTLVLAEVEPTAHGAKVTVCGVGDSEAWLLQDGVWGVLHHERDRGDENATRHLPGHPDPQVAPVYSVRSGAVLVLGTDGFAAALSTDGSPLARELAQRWRQPPPPLEFLAHVGFVEGFRTDDRAVVAVWIR